MMDLDHFTISLPPVVTFDLFCLGGFFLMAGLALIIRAVQHEHFFRYDSADFVEPQLEVTDNDAETLS